MKPLTLIQWLFLQWMAKERDRHGNAPDPGYYPSFVLDKQGVPSLDKMMVRKARGAALEMIRRNWTYTDEFKNHRLNEVGMKAARELPKPEWTPPKLPTLKEQDYAVLRALEFANQSKRWVSPLDCGGSNGSHHSFSLAKLVRHELAEERVINGAAISGDASVIRPHLFHKAKGSKKFRITLDGIKIVKEQQQHDNTRSH